MSDYHLHLHPHKPVAGAPAPGVYPPGYIDQYVERALERGVTELGFTEHLFRCVESEPALGHWWESDPNRDLAAEQGAWVTAQRNLSLERYVEVVLDAKDRGLPVKLGLEVDFQPGTEEAVLDLLSGYPFDFLIGSVHWIGGWGIDRPSAHEEFARRGIRPAYEQYFELVTALAKSGMVDVLAHADVIKRTGIVPDSPYIDLYAMVVAAAAANDVAVEVSSAGLRRKPSEIFPAPTFLELFNASGVPITLASDAHVPADAGYGNEMIIAEARAAGYTHHLRYENRVPRPVPLAESHDVPAPRGARR